LSNEGWEFEEEEERKRKRKRRGRGGGRRGEDILSRRFDI